MFVSVYILHFKCLQSLCMPSHVTHFRLTPPSPIIGWCWWGNKTLMIGSRREQLLFFFPHSTSSVSFSSVLVSSGLHHFIANFCCLLALPKQQENELHKRVQLSNRLEGRVLHTAYVDMFHCTWCGRDYRQKERHYIHVNWKPARTLTDTDMQISGIQAGG